jgi:hypothetical protein
MVRDKHITVRGFDVDENSLADHLRAVADAIEEGEAPLVGFRTHQDAEADEPLTLGHTLTYSVPRTRTDLMPTVPLNDSFTEGTEEETPLVEGKEDE